MMTAAHFELPARHVVRQLKTKNEASQHGNLIQGEGSDTLKTAFETRGKTA